MTQKIRAINIANNTFKNFVFDSAVSSLINTAAVAYSTANAANALAQAANTVVVSQASQAVAPTINTISITDSSYNVIDDTAANTGGAYLRITGSGFQTGATVLVGSSNTALSTTLVNSSTLRSQIGPISSGTYPVYVVNTNGGTAIRLNGLTVSSFPAWSTGSTLANVISNTAFSGTLSANSDSSVTYANTTVLPTGFTLLANGYYYGTISAGVNTTYSFDVKATDAENQDTTRTFSLTALSGLSSVEYLIVAGGGGGGGSISGGGGGGGGGAGGLKTGTYDITLGSSYSVTIGSGGAGGTSSLPAPGVNQTASSGSTSQFATVGTDGGGGGGCRIAGSPGGSGGGGGGGGGFRAGGSASPNGFGGFQGNSGGAAATSYDASGGGGGAGSSGTTGGNNGNNFGGPGGSGYTWPTTGSTYAGGGGGGSSGTNAAPGQPGPGGGGQGGGQGQARTSGSVNTGGGGGGAGAGSSDNAPGASGGSGIVIISYPTAYSNASSTTGASYTSIGGKRIYTWTSSGSITF